MAIPETGDLILKLVNASSDSKYMKIDLSNFNINSEAEKTILSGDAEDENTFENLDNVKPEKSIISIQSKFNYDAPAMSLSVIRIKIEK